MVQSLEQKTYTPQEYFDLEIGSVERHEYIAGEIVLMPGGTPNHNKIAGNLYSSLNFSLKKQPYDVFIADQRLWIPQRNILTYPDVMVVAQPLEFQEGRRDTITNPLLIAEVLSPSTKAYDRDEKFAAYRTIPSFQEYLLIDQHRHHIEQYIKIEPQKWTFIEYSDEDTVIALDSISSSLEVADLYDKVNFETEE